MTRAAVMVLALLVPNVLMGALSLVIARSERTTRALRSWGWGLLVYSAGLLVTLITFLPFDLTKVVGTGLIALAPFLMIAAVLNYTPYRLHTGWAAAGILVTLGLLIGNDLLEHPLVLVDFLGPAPLANILFLIGAIALWNGPPSDAKWAAWILSGSFFFTIAAWMTGLTLLWWNVGGVNSGERAGLTVPLAAIAQTILAVTGTLALMWIEMRMMEAQLRQQNEALAEGARRQGGPQPRWSGIERISRHNLRTPLNNVVSLVQIIREDPTLPAQHEASLRLIEQAGYRVLNMANLTLDLFKMEQGTYQFTPQTVDLQAVTELVLLDLQPLLRAAEVTCDVRSEGFEERGQPLVRGDEMLVYSSLTNVLKNAAEASPKGGTVAVRIINGDWPQVRIHNLGAIPEEMRGRLFEKYATGGKKGGTGLGAYSASLMMNAQDGRIHADTSDPLGTTIILEWMAADSGQVRDRAAAEAPGSLPLRPSDIWPARKILVADDDPDNRGILRHFLSHPRWIAEEAENGHLALETFRTASFDCVFLDLDMPRMDGFEAAAEMRAIERSRQNGAALTTIVAVSSHDDKVTRERALRSGFDLYLTKPVNRRQIVEVVLGRAAPEASVELEADVRHLVPSFLENKKKDVQGADEALASNDPERARRELHRLRGSLSMYGFREAAALCAELEDLVRSNDLVRAHTRLAALSDYLDQVNVCYKEESGGIDNVAKDPGR